MSQLVQEILDRIEHLSSEDRRVLDEVLDSRLEQAWKQEAELARRSAQAQSLDQSAIDRAVEAVRYGK